MNSAFTVVDDFCPGLELIAKSAYASGFGRWAPNKGAVGSSKYDGMNFVGLHAPLVRALSFALGGPVFPNLMFFRLTNRDMEKAYIHSDRESGSWTAIVYLSEHQEVSGTGFYRHRRTGMLEMPSFAEMKRKGVLKKMAKEMVDGKPEHWERTDFVRGLFNRALIFRAPLFHSRIPIDGFRNPKEDRLVWVCHFERE